MNPEIVPEIKNKTEKVDFKGEGEFITFQELQKELSLYGEASENSITNPKGKDPWEIIFKPNENLKLGDVTYTLVVPHGDFRKDSKSVRTNEVQVVLLDNSEKDSQFIKNWLKDTAQDGMLMGQEVEFAIREYDLDTPEGRRRSIDRAFTICKEGMEEGFLNMREFSEIKPATDFNDFKKSLLRLLDKILIESRDDSFILEFTGSNTERVPISEMPYTTLKSEYKELMPLKAQKICGYIESVTKVFAVKMLEKLPLILSQDKDVAETLNQIAIAHNVEPDPDFPSRSLGEVFLRKYLFDVWMIRALHISVGVPQHENGMIPQTAMKASANGAIYFSDVVNVLNYSGNMVHGARVRLPNKNNELVDILSGRQGIRNLIATSRAPGLIESDIDFKNLKEKLLFQGKANSIDRTTGKIEIIDEEGKTHVFAPIHSEVRSRDSVPFIKFIDFIKKRNNGEDVKLTTGARLEFTGPDLTPELFGGNAFAVALRTIIVRAAMIGASENKEVGKFDFIKWLEKNKILEGTNAKEVYKTHDSQGVHDNLMRAVRGELDLNKIKHLENLVNLVEQKTIEEFRESKDDKTLELPDHWVNLFKDARKGISEIKDVRSKFSSHRKMWAKVMDGLRSRWAARGNVGGAGIEMYEAFCDEGGGSAAKVNFLTNTEIATILLDKFKVSTIRIPEEDGTVKEFKLDNDVIGKWLSGEESGENSQEYNDARAYLTTLLFHLHAEDALRKFESNIA